MTEEEKELFIHQQGIYDRMSDTIMYLSTNCVMKMNLCLYNYSTKFDKGRDFYYSETEYYSSKANAMIRNIRRGFHGFLSLETIGKAIRREYVMIFPGDLELLRMTLVPKLQDIIANYDSIYTDDHGKIKINPYKAFEVDIGNNILIFAPGVNINYNGEQAPVVDMFINSNTTRVPIWFSRVYELLYILQTFNMHQYMATMLNFIQRPPAGLNLYNSETARRQDETRSMEMKTPTQRKHRILESDRQAMEQGKPSP